MDDWDRDEHGMAKVDAVLGYAWAVAADMGVAIKFEHVQTMAAYEAGEIETTQLVLSADQAEAVAKALLDGAAMTRLAPLGTKPS